MIELYPGATPPAYATPRDPARPSRGGRAAAISGILGAPFMPHQAWITDVSSEIGDEPDSWRYKVVIVSIPRQSGKTTILRAKNLDRALARPARQVLATAQTGKDARAKWREWCDTVTARDSPLAPFAHLRRSAGTEALTFPNRSFLAPFAPTPKSLHGYTPHDVSVDEAWSFGELAGSALIAAVSPAQITLPDRQLWLVSTMGDASSTWWHALVDRGRLAVTDPHSDVAYFEWSADEDLAAADPYGLDTLGFHPALGHTQTIESLLAEAHAPHMSLENWRRSYLNLRTKTRISVVDLAAFDKLATPDADAHMPPLADSWVGYAVARDRSGAAIWCAHRLASGVPCVHHIASRAGSSWVAEWVLKLRRVRGIVADAGPETRAVTAEIIASGRPVDVLTATERATAHVAFVGAIKDEAMRHDPTPGLRDSLDVVVLDRGLGFDPIASAGPIAHAEAAAVAAFRATHGANTPPIA